MLNKVRRLGPVVGDQLPGVKLCPSCQERFKGHMAMHLPANSANNGGEPIPIPDFVLCNNCWDFLMEKAGVTEAERKQIQQGAVTVH